MRCNMNWKCKYFDKIDKPFFDYGIGAFNMKGGTLIIILPHRKDLKKYSIIKVKVTLRETFKDINGKTYFKWNGDINNLTLENSLDFNGVTIHCHIKDGYIIPTEDNFK